MPTGYTESLKGKDYDVKSWLTEDVIRAMGLLVGLRDHGDLTKEELIKELKDRGSYHQEKLDKATAEYKSLRDRSDDQWKANWKLDTTHLKLEHSERMSDFSNEKESFLRALEQLGELLEKTEKCDDPNEDVIYNTILLGIQQIRLTLDYDYDVEPSLRVCDTLEEYKSKKLKEAKRDISYHTKEFAKAALRRDKGVKLYLEFVKFINKEKR